VGYGAVNPAHKNVPQQKLLALRASELDAYRALAERISGVRIQGMTTVNDFIAENDQLRATVNMQLRHAIIRSQQLNADGYYETVLQLELDPAFMQSVVLWTCDGPRKPVRGASSETDNKQALQSRRTCNGRTSAGC
jgi:hypothetical protein